MGWNTVLNYVYELLDVDACERDKIRKWFMLWTIRVGYVEIWTLPEKSPIIG